MLSCAMGYHGEYGEFWDVDNTRRRVSPCSLWSNGWTDSVGFVSLSRQNRRRIQISSSDCDEKCDNNRIL